MLSNLKICGITSPEIARFCAEAGVGALGAVFYARSPRHVTPAQARAIFAEIPPRVARVGVFAGLPAAEVAALARDARLDTVQLHGDESLTDAAYLLHAGFRVIRALKVAGDALLHAARALPNEIGILVECGRGTLPGGNGAAWRWADAAPLAAERPFALAGGLTPDNLAEAARNSRACAWDLSSGVERAPGVKDPVLIARAVAALADNPCLAAPSRAFWSHSNQP